MSKRIRLRLLSCVGLAMALAMLVGACGGGEAPTPAPTATPAPGATGAPTTAAPVAPVPPTLLPKPTTDPVSGDVAGAKYGGVLTRLATGGVATWDIHREISLATHGITMPVYDTLIRRNPFNENEVVPSLAESWKASSDGLTWTFKIRSNVRFHNGDPLTAEDIRHTYVNHITNPPKGVASVYRAQLAPVDTVEVPDPFTLVLKLKGRDAAFLSLLAHARLGIYSKKFVETNGLERTTQWPPMGTGPFKGLASGWNRGVSVEVVRNENFWVPGRPFLDGIKDFEIADQGTAFAAFLAAKINFGLTLNPSEEREVKSRLGDRVVLQETVGIAPRVIAFNTRLAPFNDIRLRRAVTLAVDKKEVSELLAPGRGIPGGGFLVPGTPFALSDQELLAFDGYSPDKQANLAKARDLMAQAGLAGGFSISILTRQSAGYIEADTVLKAMVEQIGITATLNILETGRYFATRIPDNPAWQVANIGLGLAGSDPNEVYSDLFLPGGGRSFSGIGSDPKLQALFKAQNDAVDPAERIRLVKEMERYTLGLYAYSMVGRTRSVNAMYANIKNYKFASESTHYNRQYRDVWIER